MPLFGPPNIEKLKARKDVKGLAKALQDHRTVAEAAAALGWLQDASAVPPLIAALDTTASRSTPGTSLPCCRP